MTASNAYETDHLKHLLQNIDLALVGDATGLRGSSVPGHLYVSLLVADPGEAADQTTSEASYPGYARVAVERSPTGWTVSGNQGSNAGPVTFPEHSGGADQAVSHFGIGTSPTGAGKLIVSHALAVARNVVAGVAPKFNAGQLVVTLD